MNRTSESKSATTWLPLLALVVAASAVHIANPTLFLSDLSYLLLTFGVGVMAVWYAWKLGDRRRAPWMWIAFGVLCSGCGDLTFWILVWQRGEAPDASIGDMFWLLSYVALSIGLLGMLGLHNRTEAKGSRYDVDGLIDLGSFVILAVLLVSEITNVGDIFADTEVSVTVQLIWAAYPILDGALLAVLVRAIIGKRVHGASGGLLALGISMWLASDMATLLIADASTISIWMDLGWMLGAAAMTAAVLGGKRIVVEDEERRDRRLGGARVLMSLAPLLLPASIETWTYFQHQDPNPIPLLVATAALIVLAYLRSTRLVKARDAKEAELIRNKHYFRSLAQNSADAVIVVDEHGVMISDSSRLAAMIGIASDGIGFSVLDMIDQRDRERVAAALRRVAATSTVQEIELRAQHTDGGERWFATRSVNLLDDETVHGIVVNIQDITDRKRAEDELTHRAFHDSLTGLANRALFLDRVEHALQRSARSGADVAVIYLDIDGFKTVNDSRGHEAGDQVLREIAKRLQSTMRSGDTVARLGGDEFAILIDQDSSSATEGTVAAERILSVLKPPIALDDSFVTLSASIGITHGDGIASASSMLRDADIAMYRAKTTGKGRWTVYDSTMRIAALERMELETDLVNALADNQFQLVYQPIIELVSEEVVGFEALLRWHHPTRGIVQPDAFIPIAEDTGSIVPIGQWVLEEACRMAARFQQEHPLRPLTMAVNLSARQIATVDLVQHVADAIRDSGMAPSSLILEMTESALIEDAPTAAARLHQLRALGVRIAIDDFGTGYSSLSYLRQFPIDILKIDRSFVNSITERDTIPAIVRGLLDLGKTLELETVAEGIELGVQRDSLRDQNCEFGQGFLFARPLSVSDCDVLLDRLDDGESVEQTDVLTGS